MDEDLIKKVDMEKIADEGTKIYEEVKSKYLPQDIGKYLAIDIDSKDVFLGEYSSDAVELAKKAHPNKVFFVVKIGYSAAEILSDLDITPTHLEIIQLANGKDAKMFAGMVMVSMEGTENTVGTFITEIIS